MIALGRIERQRQRREDRAEKQPGAELARDEIGVLALPAKARRLRQRLLHHGRGVDENLDLRRAKAAMRAAATSQPASCFRRALDDVVIVAVARIDRDIAGALIGESRQRIAGRPVIHPQHQDAGGLGPKRGGIGAARRRRSQPVHVAGGAGREPGGKPLAGAFDRSGRSCLADVETKLQRLRLKRAQKSRSA